MNYIKTFESFIRTDNLSGILLFVEGRILLVHAKKHKKSKRMWSIPKGQIEGKSLTSALKELKEETGINLDKYYDDKFTIKYYINGKIKILKVYTYKRSLSDLSKYITPGFKIKKKTLRSIDDEIYDIKFFTLPEAIDYLQPGQKQVINHLVYY